MPNWSITSKMFRSYNEARQFIKDHRNDLGEDDYKTSIGKLDIAWNLLRDAMNDHTYLKLIWKEAHLQNVEIVDRATGKVVKRYD